MGYRPLKNTLVVAPPQQHLSSATSILPFPSSATPPQFEDLLPFPEVHSYVSRTKCLTIEVMNYPLNEAGEQNVNAASIPNADRPPAPLRTMAGNP